MDPFAWLSFFLLALVAIATPGPGNLNTARRAVQFGQRRVIACIVGNAAGILVAGALCTSAFAVLIAQSSVVGQVISLIGIAYLSWLGLQSIYKNEPIEVVDASVSSYAPKKLFLESFFLSATNPKGFVFYTAVFPQFIDPLGSRIVQSFIIVVTCAVISLTTHSIYSYFAAWTRQIFLVPARYRLFRQITGGILLCIAIGLFIDLFAPF